MTEPKPRRWFRLHLSTAFVLMLVAAVFGWMNTKPSIVSIVMPGYSQLPAEYFTYPYVQALQFGFPFKAVQGYRGEYTLIPNGAWFAVLDALLAVTVLVGVGCALEYLTRRESRKP